MRDADDPAGQWDGWIPFEEMPKQRDPARGFVATANSQTDPAQCAAVFTATHCEPRYRTDQIGARLAARRDHDAASFAAVQRDVSADYAPALRDAIVAAIGAVSGNDVAARALAVLRAWDGTFPSDSAGAALFALLQQDLPFRLFVPLLGASLGPRFAHGRRAMPRLHRLLLDADDALRADIERAARRPLATLVREAFFAGVEQLAATQGNDPVAWRWGAVQRVWLGTPLGLLPLVGRRFVALDADFPGDEYTINPSRSIPVPRQALRLRRRHQPLHLRPGDARRSALRPQRRPERRLPQPPLPRRRRVLATLRVLPLRAVGSRRRCRTSSSGWKPNSNAESTEGTERHRGLRVALCPLRPLR